MGFRVLLAVLVVACVVTTHAQKDNGVTNVLVENLKWLRDHGVSHTVAFHEELGLAGVIPEGDTGVESGELLATIPVDAMLCGGREDQVVQVGLQYGIELHSLVALAYKLLMARVDPSNDFHAVTLSLKPVDSPVSWDASDVELIDAYDRSFVNSRREFVAKTIQDLTALAEKVPHIVPANVFTPFNIRWALQQCWAMGLLIDGNQCFPPLISFFRPIVAGVSSVELTDKAVLVKAGASSPKLTTVSIAVPHTTLEMTLNMGVFPDVPIEHDHVIVAVGVAKESPFHALRADLMKQIGADPNSPRMPLYGDRESSDLLKVLRLQFMQTSEMVHAERVGRGLPATLRSERKVLRFLLNFCDNALAEYTTTEEEDEATAEDTTASFHARIAAKTRLNRRRVYKGAREQLIASWDSYLDNGWPADEQASK